MTARADYVGPITKSAEAMFARAERKTIARKLTAPPPSALREIITSFGLSPTIIRRWEEAGLVAFERQGGRVVVNDTTREHLATVIELRAAGFSVKEIAWISDTLPPTIKQMRDALAARQAQTVSKPSTQLGSAFSRDHQGLWPQPDRRQALGKCRCRRLRTPRRTRRGRRRHA